MSLTDASALSGAVLIEAGGEVNLSLDSSSTWTAMADSTLTTLTGMESSDGQATNVDAENGITITCGSINGDTGVSFAFASGGTLTALRSFFPEELSSQPIKKRPLPRSGRF